MRCRMPGFYLDEKPEKRIYNQKDYREPEKSPDSEQFFEKDFHNPAKIAIRYDNSEMIEN